MNDKYKQFSNVIEYSETMLKEAKAGNWKDVFKVEKQRSHILKNYFRLRLQKMIKTKITKKYYKFSI